MAPKSPKDTTATPAADLQFEEVEWNGRGAVREPHPAIVERLRKSWDNRIVKGNAIKTPAYRVTYASTEQRKELVADMRAAGDVLNVGVGVRIIETTPTTGEIHFRARKRRGSAVPEVAPAS